MYLSPTIQQSRENKVSRVMAETGCKRDEAISYLYAEKWFVPDAVLSYRIDHPQTTELIPALLAEFADNIRIFKGMPKTDETVKAASALIDQYTGRLQLLDLTLSQTAARGRLREIYLTL